MSFESFVAMLVLIFQSIVVSTAKVNTINQSTKFFYDKITMVVVDISFCLALEVKPFLQHLHSGFHVARNGPQFAPPCHQLLRFLALGNHFFCEFV